jgi:hypothetical protein
MRVTLELIELGLQIGDLARELVAGLRGVFFTHGFDFIAKLLDGFFEFEELFHGKRELEAGDGISTTEIDFGAAADKGEKFF